MIGKPYIYQCEHVTGHGKFYGETVAMAECDKPATLQPDNTFKCEDHAEHK